MGSAQCLNVVNFSVGEIDFARAVDSLQRICTRGKERGLRVAVEFLPWSQPGSLKEAQALVEATGCENLGLVLDTWHFFKSGEDFSQFAALPGSLVAGTQFNGVLASPTSADIIEETMNERLFPGEGANDVVRFVRELDAIGSLAPIGIEVFNRDLQQRPPIEVAKKAVAAMRDVLRQAREASAVRHAIDPVQP